MTLAETYTRHIDEAYRRGVKDGIAHAKKPLEQIDLDEEGRKLVIVKRYPMERIKIGDDIDIWFRKAPGQQRSVYVAVPKGTLVVRGELD